jgi:hypothetical protein
MMVNGKRCVDGTTSPFGYEGTTSLSSTPSLRPEMMPVELLTRYVFPRINMRDAIMLFSVNSAMREKMSEINPNEWECLEPMFFNRHSPWANSTFDESWVSAGTTDGSWIKKLLPESERVSASRAHPVVFNRSVYNDGIEAPGRKFPAKVPIRAASSTVLMMGCSSSRVAARDNWFWFREPGHLPTGHGMWKRPVSYLCVEPIQLFREERRDWSKVLFDEKCLIDICLSNYCLEVLEEEESDAWTTVLSNFGCFIESLPKTCTLNIREIPFMASSSAVVEDLLMTVQQSFKGGNLHFQDCPHAASPTVAKLVFGGMVREIEVYRPFDRNFVDLLKNGNDVPDSEFFGLLPIRLDRFAISGFSTFSVSFFVDCVVPFARNCVSISPITIRCTLVDSDPIDIVRSVNELWLPDVPNLDVTVFKHSGSGDSGTTDKCRIQRVNGETYIVKLPMYTRSGTRFSQQEHVFQFNGLRHHREYF